MTRLPVWLTQLGARAYDSTLGRFVSADAVLAPFNPAQNNGYVYAANNPITQSDPSGQCYHGSPTSLRHVDAPSDNSSIADQITRKGKQAMLNGDVAPSSPMDDAQVQLNIANIGLVGLNAAELGLTACGMLSEGAVEACMEGAANEEEAIAAQSETIAADEAAVGVTANRIAGNNA